MQLYYSTGSPFVRKCMVVAHELGIAQDIAHLPQAAHPIHRRDNRLLADNPLGQLPTFLCDDGTPLYDSRVICEYLDARQGGGLFPTIGRARWTCLTEVALADGMLTAALQARYETLMRPPAVQWQGWSDAQLQKVHSGLAWLEQAAPGLGSRVDIGTIAMACMLEYLDFRFPQLVWRNAAPAAASWLSGFGKRESMRATGFRELATPLNAAPPAGAQ